MKVTYTVTLEFADDIGPNEQQQKADYLENLLFEDDELEAENVTVTLVED